MNEYCSNYAVVVVAFIQRTGVRDEESIILYVYKRNVYHGV